MRIYNKTLPEIFDQLPWQYKIFVTACTLFLVFAVVHLSYLAISLPSKKTEAAPLYIGTLGGENILDPSLAYDSVNDKIYLAYSKISSVDEGEIGGGVSVYMVESTPPCKDWSLAAKIFETKAEDVIAPDGGSDLATGLWRYETPSLVYDPDDKGREWKAYAYKYFWSGNPDFAKRYSVIAYKYATDPKGVWSGEEWAMAAAPGFPPEPYQSLVQTQISTLSPALRGFASFTRPSVVLVGKYMVMALTGLDGKRDPAAVVLLGSSDHGRSWSYMGMPLTRLDAPKVGAYNRMNGATLIMEGGKLYLAAVFGDDKRDNAGTHILRFADLTSGKLLRDDKGMPVVIKYIPLSSEAPTATGGGFAAFNEHCKTGVIASEMSGLKRKFSVFKTYETPTATLK